MGELTQQESEIVTFKGDRNVNGLPREGYARKKGNPPGPAALWAAHETKDLSIDVWGQYPKRFLPWAPVNSRGEVREGLPLRYHERRTGHLRRGDRGGNQGRTSPSAWRDRCRA